MYPTTHLLFAFLVAEISVHLGMLEHWHAVVVTLLAVAVDLDHYILYAVRHKDLSWKHFWNDSNTGKELHGKSWLHFGKGFLLMAILVGGVYFLSKTAALVIALAYLTHMFLDYIILALIKVWCDPFQKRPVKLKVFGFVFVMSLYEIILDLLLAVGIAVISLI